MGWIERDEAYARAYKLKQWGVWIAVAAAAVVIVLMVVH